MKRNCLVFLVASLSLCCCAVSIRPFSLSLFPSYFDRMEGAAAFSSKLLLTPLASGRNILAVAAVDIFFLFFALCLARIFGEETHFSHSLIYFALWVITATFEFGHFLPLSFSFCNHHQSSVGRACVRVV